MLQSFLRDRRGATALEYGLIAGFISIAIAASATGIGADIAAIFTSVADKFSAAS